MTKKQELYESLLIKKKKRGLEDLFYFNKHIIESDPNRQKFLVPHVDGEWTEWYRKSKHRIKMILVPRACFKSTFFTVGRTLQALCQSRDSRILIANATLANSQNFLNEIKMHLRKNEQLKQLYGEFYDKNLKWSQDEIEISGRSLGAREPSVSAAGVGGNLVSRHYSMIIADDLMNLENSATRYQTDKVIDWWKRAFSLLDYDGEMVIIGTRWSYYDLYQHIVDTFSARADIYIRGAYKDDEKLYFPELLSEDKLEELKGLQGSYIFSSFYLNDPVDEESALIKRSQIKYYGKGEEVQAPTNLHVFAVCDPAVSQSTQADYSCILIIGVDFENNWYVLEVRRDKWTVGELIEQLFAVNELWKPITTSIEVIGQAQGLMTPIHDEENRRNKYLPLFEIKARPDVKKEMRIRSVLQPRFERGKIFIKREMFDLEEEILKFPRSRHDDMIDAMTDMDEISFTPEEVKKPSLSTGNYFEDILKKREREKSPGDFYMGEFF
jgi:predicted phage terminase large subunit-like protein